MEPTYNIGIQSASDRTAIHLSVIADKVEDRHSTVVRAATEAELIAKLYKEYNLLPCPVKDTIFRTPEECDRIRKEWDGPTDKTEIAVKNGYKGTAPVILQERRIVSHKGDHRYLDFLSLCYWGEEPPAKQTA